jgi:hypothetical protein
MDTVMNLRVPLKDEEFLDQISECQIPRNNLLNGINDDVNDSTDRRVSYILEIIMPATSTSIEIGSVL